MILFSVTRHLNYPAYQFNVLRMIIFSRKFNVYFALSKDYALKVSLNFFMMMMVMKTKIKIINEFELVKLFKYSDDHTW